jgi:hypothetical protein
MVLEYFYKTGENYRYVDYGDGQEAEWDGDDGYDFEYEIDSSQVIDALIYIIKNNVKRDLKYKSRNPEKYHMTNDMIEFLGRKFTDVENKFIDAILLEVFDSMYDNDSLDDFAELYRDEIAEYYENDAMESQE